MSFKLLESPRLEELVNYIKTALNSKSTVLLIGECRVDYEGRASSRLEPGERLVIIKQDGAILVHRPTGYSPVNWQPSTSIIEVIYKEGVGLVIHALRDRPREYLTIVFTRINIFFAGKLVDAGNFTMYIDEKEMRDILANNPLLIEDGLRVIAVEKPVGDGFVDIYAIDKDNRHVLIELKRVTATREAVLQLFKYVEAYKNEFGEKPRGILIAPAFSPSALETALNLDLEYKYIDLKKVREYAKKKVRRTLLSDFTTGSKNDFSH
jgi:RecB family endonuclease NucS